MKGLVAGAVVFVALIAAWIAVSALLIPWPNQVVNALVSMVIGWLIGVTSFAVGSIVNERER